MGFAGRGNEKDRQLGMGMGFAVRTKWEWQNTKWGSLPLTVLIGSRDVFLLYQLLHILFILIQLLYFLTIQTFDFGAHGMGGERRCVRYIKRVIVPSKLRSE
jgi:hypothetical protein